MGRTFRTRTPPMTVWRNHLAQCLPMVRQVQLPGSNDDNAHRSAVQQSRNRRGKLLGTRGPAAEPAEPAKPPYCVGKFPHKGYVQVFDTDANSLETVGEPGPHHFAQKSGRVNATNCWTTY